jgi:hypothetical protein
MSAVFKGEGSFHQLKNAQRSTLNAQRSTEMSLREKEKKAWIDNQSKPFTRFYPAGAVQVDLPFPFGKRRMTVTAVPDFQLRPVILRATKPPYFVNYRFGDVTYNLEHRRVNFRKPSVES